MNYAGIGSRNLDENQLDICRKLGTTFAIKGYTLKTGAAKGADQAFAEGALQARGKVILYLPWYSYEAEWVQQATKNGAITTILSEMDEEAHKSVDLFHPQPKNLSQGARKLHARNWLILKDTEFLIAYPTLDQYGGMGGTGQGIRIAQSLGWVFSDRIINLATIGGRTLAEAMLL